MTQVFDEEGNITTVKGDTILFDVNNVPNDLDYTVFFRIYDNNNNSIIPETIIDADGNSTVTVEVKPYATDLITIPTGKKSVTYFYGIKACNFDNQIEHTLTVDGVDLNQETKITFMRKRVEGYYYYGDLFPWINGTTIIYTNTDTPEAGSSIYTAEGMLTGDTVSSVTTEDDEVTAIVVSGVTYSRPQPEGDDDSDSDGDSDTDTDNNS